jgi:DNA-binding transcriptional LysR family regulator
MRQSHSGWVQGLPSLKALRGFEAAARHLNVVRAAEELCITQGALSRQIQSLEQHLGVTLFIRTSRGLKFTEAGDNLWMSCRQAFAILEDGLGSVGAVKRRETLVVAVARSYATRCLAHRIGEFIEQHPWIEVRLDGHRHLADLSSDADLAIRVGNGAWPGLHVESLGRDPVVPVAAPSVAERVGLEPPMEVIVRETMLNFTERDLWAVWSKVQGWAMPPPSRTVSFSETVMMLEAAEAGQGIAVARKSLVEESLKKGTLVALYAEPVDDGIGYYFCCVPEALGRRKVASFRDWLFEGQSLDAA